MNRAGKKRLTVMLIWGHNQRDNRPFLRSQMQTKRCACLNCGHLLSASGTIQDGVSAAPHEGDYTVCLYCSHLMVYRDDLSVRNLTSAEIIEAAGDKDILEVMKFASAFREYAANEQKKNS